MSDRAPIGATERPFLALVAVAGVVSVGLVFALAFALFPDRPWTAMGAAVAVCAPFGLIIGVGLRRLRVREVLPPLAVDTVEEEPCSLVVGVEDELRRWEANRRLAVRVALVLCPVVGAALALFLGDLVSVVLGVLVGGMFVAMAPLLTATDRAALKLLAGAGPRAVTLDGEGVRLPVEVVTEPAFHLAIEADETEVFVAWRTIVRWQVLEGTGGAHAQHLLHVAPSTRRFPPFHRFAIVRCGALRARDADVIAFARRHLACAIEVRSDDVGSRA